MIPGEEIIVNWKNDKIKAQYQEGISYLRSQGLMDQWKENIDFYDGNQWKAASEETKNLPRPVFNIISYIINHKCGSVLNETIKMVFTSQEIEDIPQAEDPQLAMLMPQQIPGPIQNPMVQAAMEGADKFSKYATTLWENIEQDRLNEQLIYDGALLGTGILHYYWDNTISGGITKTWIGDVRAEVIDPVNVFFGNPQESEVQKQPYIIISSREMESNVRALALENQVPEEYIELIQADQEQAAEAYSAAQEELKSSRKVTVLTKYEKVDGTIRFTKVCGDIIIQQQTDTELTLYPLVVFQYEPKKKSIHGNSDVRGNIPNQKAINFLQAMMVLSCQNTAFPKIISKDGAIRQTITNQPGEIIIDYSGMGSVDGFKYMQVGGFNNQVLTLVQTFIETTQKFSGAQDVSMGDTPGANMAASAIMMLQKSAGISTDGIRKRFYRCMKDVGRIWEDFWKTKYNTERNVKVQDQDQEVMQNFIGTDYQGVNFDLKIDIGSAGVYSESLAQSTLENLFNQGAIDLITFLKYSPKSAMPFKDSLIKDIQAQQAAQQAMISAEIQSQLGGMLGAAGPGQAPAGGI